MPAQLMERGQEFKRGRLPAELVPPPEEHLVVLLHHTAGVFVLTDVDVIFFKPDKSHEHLPVTVRNLTEFVIQPVGGIIWDSQKIFAFILLLQVMEGGGLRQALGPAGSGSWWPPLWGRVPPSDHQHLQLNSFFVVLGGPRVDRAPTRRGRALLQQRRAHTSSRGPVGWRSLVGFAVST